MTPCFTSHCAKIVQERSPPVVLFQIFSHMFGDEDVTGIATIHHPLGHVDPGPGNVLALVHIDHFVDRTAVNTHSQRRSADVLSGLAQFPRRIAPVLRDLSRKTSAIPSPVGSRISFPSASASRNSFVPLTTSLSSRSNSLCWFTEQLGVAHDVDEQDMPDLQTGLLLRQRHLPSAQTGVAAPLAEIVLSARARRNTDLFEARIAAERVPEGVQF